MGWEDPLEEELATHSSILALRTPRTKELDGLQLLDHKESDTAEQLTLILIQSIIFYQPKANNKPKTFLKVV